MSLLQVAKMQEAQGEVKEIFNEVEKAFGAVTEGLSLWALNPEALKFQWNSIKEQMDNDTDTQKMYTLIRYIISEKNRCKYCIGLNGGMLINMYGMSEEELKEVANNLSVANLTPKNEKLLAFALRSVNEPQSIKQQDVKELRALGLSDKEIFDLVLTASMMLVVNTLFDTFNVK